MASNDRSLSGRISRWRSLFSNAQEFLPEVPHIEGDLQELRDISEKVTALRAERLIQERNLRETTLKIRKLAKRGDQIRGRIGASLKGRYGFDSLLLIQFGFTPRKKGIDRDPKLSDEASLNLSPTRAHALPGAGEEASGGTNEVGAPDGRILS